MAALALVSLPPHSIGEQRADTPMMVPANAETAAHQLMPQP
jgi:hypothetical protein